MECAEIMAEFGQQMGKEMERTEKAAENETKCKENILGGGGRKILAKKFRFSIWKLFKIAKFSCKNCPFTTIFARNFF